MRSRLVLSYPSACSACVRVPGTYVQGSQMWRLRHATARVGLVGECRTAVALGWVCCMHGYRCGMSPVTVRMPIPQPRTGRHRTSSGVPHCVLAAACAAAVANAGACEGGG